MKDKTVASNQIARDRELSIKRNEHTCKHFNGIHRDICMAGVSYRALVGGSDLGWATRIPCIVSSLTKEPVPCDKREYPTLEEAAAQVDATEASFELHRRAHRKAHDDAKAKGYRQGHGGNSQCVCPICNGTLRYSVASYNGHMYAKCETDGCVSWME